MEDLGDAVPPAVDRQIDLTDGPAEHGIDATVFAVVAHGLLNSLSVIQGVAEMMDATHETASPEKMHSWLRAIDKHASLIRQILQDLVHGLPDEAVVALDQLDDGPRR